MLGKTTISSPSLREPWRDEAFHGNGFCPRLARERGAAGQRRMSLHYAAALATSALESAQALAEKLRACRPGKRCGSGTCPPCTSATNRWFRAALADLAADAAEMQFITIQLPDRRALLAHLEELDIDFQKALLNEALNDAGLGGVPMRGALDLSYDIWTAESTKCWAIHWALYTWDRSGVALTRALTSVMADHRLILVPVKTKSIRYTPDRVFSYGFKNVFERKFIPAAGNKRDKIIRPGDAQFDTLAINLDRIGIMPRVFTQAIDCPRLTISSAA